MQNQNLQLHLTVEEINLILENLGQLPYLKVYPLIHKIQQQANAQVTTAQQAAEGNGIKPQSDQFVESTN
ncbi:MAG: hypothetical protein AAFZ15_23095 [Bacteroidota bacterium]